jgi:hypothetical protein
MGIVDVEDTNGTSSYNGLLLTAQHRFAKNYIMQTNYTWSHCLDQGSITGSTVTNIPYEMPNNRVYDSGDCSTDRRQIFNLTAAYRTPQFSSTALRILASNWQVAPIFERTSGVPLNVLAGSDVQLNGANDQNGNNYERPNVSGNAYGSNTGGFPQWLNPAAFSVPAPGTFGNSQRNSLVGPAFWTFNMALSREFRILEKSRLEARMEAFNVTNSFIPVAPTNLTITSAAFGKITAAYPTRVLQFALKYVF